MSRIVTGNILDTRIAPFGVIVQQVNCRNAYGAGISGAIARRYPIVEEKYRQSFNEATPNQLFGTYRLVRVSSKLAVANCYTQFNYGRLKPGAKPHTDMDKLVAIIHKLAKHGLPVYIPYGIGCGLAGGNWDELYPRIKDIDNLTIVKLP